MCNLTALPPHRPAAQRHKCGTLAAPRRSRTAASAPPQRTKVGKIRYLCGPNCGFFSAAGTAWRRFCSFCARKFLQKWVTHQESIIIYATWVLPNFPIPKFNPGLPFSPPAPARPPFRPQIQLENEWTSIFVAAIRNSQEVQWLSDDNIPQPAFGHVVDACCIPPVFNAVAGAGLFQDHGLLGPA
jgi:hypothetical protein